MVDLSFGHYTPQAAEHHLRQASLHPSETKNTSAKFFLRHYRDDRALEGSAAKKFATGLYKETSDLGLHLKYSPGTDTERGTRLLRTTEQKLGPPTEPKPLYESPRSFLERRNEEAQAGGFGQPPPHPMAHAGAIHLPPATSESWIRSTPPATPPTEHKTPSLGFGRFTGGRVHVPSTEENGDRPVGYAGLPVVRPDTPTPPTASHEPLPPDRPTPPSEVDRGLPFR